MSNSPTTRSRLTFELSDETLTALSVRAALEERTLSSMIRRLLNVSLGLTEESEPPRDTTPALPGIQ